MLMSYYKKILPRPSQRLRLRGILPPRRRPRSNRQHGPSRALRPRDQSQPSQTAESSGRETWESDCDLGAGKHCVLSPYIYTIKVAWCLRMDFAFCFLRVLIIKHHYRKTTPRNTTSAKRIGWLSRTTQQSLRIQCRASKGLIRLVRSWLDQGIRGFPIFVCEFCLIYSCSLSAAFWGERMDVLDMSEIRALLALSALACLAACCQNGILLLEVMALPYEP
jgi:hypothetical protein